MLPKSDIQDEYDADVLLYNNILQPDHILSFGYQPFASQRTKKMYKLKTAFNEEKLKNGDDYLFLNVLKSGGYIQVWFKDKAWASHFAIKLLGNNNE